MKIITTLTGALLLTVTALKSQTYEICNWYEDKASATVLTYDDWSPGQGPIGTTRLIERGMVGTFYVSIVNASLGGGYPAMQNAVDNGLEIANHTQTHPNLTFQTPANLDWEVNGTKDTLDTRMINNNCLTLAYPFGNEDGTVRSKTQESHIAGRGIYRPNWGSSPSNSFWDYNLNSTNNSYYNLGTVTVNNTLSIPQFVDWVQDGINDGGLITFMIHSIYNSTVNDTWWDAIHEDYYVEMLDSLKNYEDQTWITTVRDAIKYHKEKKTAVLSEISQTATLWTLDLTDAEDDAIFDHPLTIKLERLAGKGVSEVRQDGNVISHQVIGNDIVFNAVPDGGNIEIDLIDASWIKEGMNFTKIEVYPNPAKNILNINAKFGENEKGSVSILNVLGDEILTFDLSTVKVSKENYQIELGTLPSGNYLVKLASENTVGVLPFVVE